MRPLIGALSALLTGACFLAGCYVALKFSLDQLTPIVEGYSRIPSIVAPMGKPLEFSCKEPECVECLEGIRDNPDGIVFTGGSAFRYALDFDAFAKAMPRPVINCIKNDSRVDAYAALFTHVHLNRPDQTILHGYNSWAINSAGTWKVNRKALTAFFVLDPIEPETRQTVAAMLPDWARPLANRFWRASDRVDLYLLYAKLFFTRGMAETPNYWRLVLKAAYPAYGRLDVAYWPLSKDAHLDRRLALMQRSFNLSAWVQSFFIDMDTVQPRADIAGRHERLLDAAEPTRRFVFLPAPELTEIFPDATRKVVAESKQMMLDTLDKRPSVLHVEIDYHACGVGPRDFWKPTVMLFDPAHVDDASKPKITRCIVEALRRANIDQFVSARP